MRLTTGMRAIATLYVVELETQKHAVGSLSPTNPGKCFGLKWAA